MTKWNLIECTEESIVQIDKDEVIFEYDGDPERWKAIARQFYATPDLLEACKATLLLFEQLQGAVMLFSASQNVKQTRELVTAAVAKAKGVKE